MLQKLKDLFIPSAQNGYKPNFLERVSVGIMLVLVLLSFTMANIQALVWMGSDWMVSTILPAVIVDLTNEERGTGSLGTLRRSDVLDRAAQLKAQDMAKYEYFAHYSPLGVSPWHWFDQVSYGFVHAGENLAVHFTDSSDVVEAWMDSPSHKANIMNGNYTEIGVGTAKGEYKGFPTIFVVQLFGTPAVKVDSVAEEIAGTESDISLETLVVQGEETGTSSESVAPATIEISPAPTEQPAAILVVEEIPTTTEPVLIVEDTTAVPATTFEESVVMYSDLATTSRPGVAAITEPNTAGPATPLTNVFERSVTQPSLWLQVMYGILGLTVVIALLCSIVIEWRRQNPVQIAYAGGLLAVMVLLFHVHTALTNGVTIM